MSPDIVNLVILMTAFGLGCLVGSWRESIGWRQEHYRLSLYACELEEEIEELMEGRPDRAPLSQSDPDAE